MSSQHCDRNIGEAGLRGCTTPELHVERPRKSLVACPVASLHEADPIFQGLRGRGEQKLLTSAAQSAHPSHICWLCVLRAAAMGIGVCYWEQCDFPTSPCWAFGTAGIGQCMDKGSLVSSSEVSTLPILYRPCGRGLLSSGIAYMRRCWVGFSHLPS